MATLKRGDVGKGRKIDGQNCLSIEDAAKLLNVSPGSVKSAKYVHEHGSPEVIRAAMQDEINVTLAEKYRNRAAESF